MVNLGAERLPPTLADLGRRLAGVERRVEYAMGLIRNASARMVAPMPFAPVGATSGATVAYGPRGVERTTVATDWETLFVHSGQSVTPKLTLRIYAMCSDSTTAGQVQVVDRAGTPLEDATGSTWAGDIPAGTTSLALIGGASTVLTLPHAVARTELVLALQAMCTTGTGTITLAITESIGG